MQNTGLIQHTDDFGQTWRLYQPMAGQNVLKPVTMRGMAVDAQGRPTFHMRVGDGSSVTGTRTCTVVAGAGQDRAEAPARDDAPGQIRLWSRGGYVPMPELGEVGRFEALFQPEALGYLGEIPHVDRNAEGDLFVLLFPDNSVSREGGPPMEVWQFDGRDPDTVKRKYRFDNLRERSGAAGNPSPYYLEARYFQVLPDGSIWIQAEDGQGNFELTREAGEQPGYGGYEGRWGDAEGGHVYVAASSPSRRDYGGVLTRWRSPTSLPGCDGDSDGEADCYVLPNARILDYAVHRDAVWVLDDYNGVVWRRPLDGSTGGWDKVLAGLMEPVRLWHTMDPQDPGMYVLEHGLWWRFVPNATGNEPVRRVR
jgi:hypothetical protein